MSLDDEHLDDPELDALATCVRVLLPLDAGARSRIIDYLDHRMQREPPRAEPDDEAPR